MSRRYFSSTAVDTTLTGSMTAASTTVTVASTTGFPSVPFTAIIDADTASEEVVDVTNVAGSTVTVTRGVDGTSAVAHSIGGTFQHGVSGRDFDEANSHVNTTSGNPHSVTASDVGAVALAGGTMTGPLLLPNGSVSAPALAPSGDTDTGIYFGSAEVSIATGGTQRVKVDSAGLLTGSGTSLGAWTDYTPTIGGLTQGNGTLVAKYVKIGRIVHFTVQFTLGSTSGVTGELTVTVPVTARATTMTALGVCTLQDAGTASVDATAEYYNGKYYLRPKKADATYVYSFTPCSATVPFTWATGDAIYVAGTYEAAT